MKQRRIIKTVTGQRTMDGAGVRLVRVLGHNTVEAFDPFLMLDSFDSTNPADYTAGFPMHPHRGIETITYLISGRIEHEDSLGNKDVIRPGESQWMTAGSGILHQEMPKESDRMLGLQLWLNMRAAEKMAPPAYLSITKDMMAQAELPGAIIRVISGRFGEARGVEPPHVPATLYDVSLEPGASVELPTDPADTVFVFLIEGEGEIGGQRIPEKTAVLFGEGDSIALCAMKEAPLRFIFGAGKPLREPIAWGGPIVMNTREELNLAFDELHRGTFIKHA